jgi:NADPH2:quinone reductase
MSIPTTQSALLIHETGGPEVVKFETNVPVPQISATQVLIKIKFAGVNFIDTYFRKGLYPATLPLILGREGAGEIVQVGANVTQFKVGDRVGFIGQNAYSEYVALEESGSVIPLPDSVDFKTAAASLIQVLTAISLVKEAHPIKKGDIVLVHAAAGGTGSLVVQLAKRRGATVIGTTSTPEKVKLVKSLGADYVINYREEDVAEKVFEYSNGHGADGVYDGVGKDTFETSLKAVARKGTLVSFGNASGAVPPVKLFDLTPKNVKLVRPGLFGYIADPLERKEYTDELFELLKDDSFVLNIYKTYDFKNGNDALIELESGKTTGKLVVQIY